ncbi:MAG: hypothetical protein GQ470_00915 [Gammaproteobacteria bacterium]|nr:hypothetical protein [Gammaproteobacteria bacterium]
MISVIKKLQKNERLVKIAPWFAGASLAVCHVAMSSNCSVTREGHCSSCGSCVIALGALVGWALMDKNRDSWLKEDTRESDSYHSN